MNKAGYVSLLENLKRVEGTGELFWTELCRLAGDHPEDPLAVMVSTYPVQDPESFWKVHLLDRSIPLAQRAAALVLAMEPDAQGVNGIGELICYGWEERFIGLIDWDKLDPELYELAYLLLVTSWRPRFEEGLGRAQRSPGTGRACVKGEYMHAVPAMVWAITHWVAQPDRVKMIFERLPFNTYSAADKQRMHAFGDVFTVLADHPDLAYEFVRSCERMVAIMVKASTEDERNFCEFHLTGFWKNLPTELLRIPRPVLAKLVKMPAMPTYLQQLWQLRPGFTWPHNFLPPREVLAFIGLMHELHEQGEFSETINDPMCVVRQTTLYTGGGEEARSSGLACTLQPVLIRALEMLHRRKGEENWRESLSDFFEIDSPLAQKGLETVLLQEGVEPDKSWVRGAASHLARALWYHLNQK